MCCDFVVVKIITEEAAGVPARLIDRVDFREVWENPGHELRDEERIGYRRDTDIQISK